MQNKPLVSCVITTYNRPELVKSAIDSVLRQTYINIELIVIDDCSAADYSEISTIADSDSRINYYRNEKNSGLSASRNNALQYCSGEFIGFLDDDDQWFANKIEKQVQVLLSNSEYVGCTSSHVESESRKIVDYGIREFRFKNILVENKIGPPSKLLLRRSLFKDMAFNITAKHSEDWDIYLKILKVGIIYSIKEPLTLYNTGHFLRMTGEMSTLSLESIKKKAEVTEKNKSVIGIRNYNRRMALYYLTGLTKRKNKIDIMRSVVNQHGLTSLLVTILKLIPRALRRRMCHTMEEQVIARRLGEDPKLRINS
jgi:glycosyltransferase involved in cell wall biosynthesis